MANINELTNEEQIWLKAFQGKYPMGSFGSRLVELWKIADLNNQRALAGAFPEAARGYELWLSGVYNR